MCKSKVFFRGGKHAFDQEKGKIQEKRKEHAFDQVKKSKIREKKKEKKTRSRKKVGKQNLAKSFINSHLSFLSLIDCQQFL